MNFIISLQEQDAKVHHVILKTFSGLTSYFIKSQGMEKQFGSLRL